MTAAQDPELLAEIAGQNQLIADLEEQLAQIRQTLWADRGIMLDLQRRAEVAEVALVTARRALDWIATTSPDRAAQAAARRALGNQS